MTNCTGTATSNVRTSRPPKTWCQETFLRWLEHYPGQKEREAIPTLYTIARNLCVDLARQRTHLPLRESDRQTPDPTGDWAEKWDLERVLARLPQEDQTLLLLRYANRCRSRP